MWLGRNELPEDRGGSWTAVMKKGMMGEERDVQQALLRGFCPVTWYKPSLPSRSHLVNVYMDFQVFLDWSE